MRPSELGHYVIGEGRSFNQRRMPQAWGYFSGKTVSFSQTSHNILGLLVKITLAHQPVSSNSLSETIPAM